MQALLFCEYMSASYLKESSQRKYAQMQAAAIEHCLMQAGYPI
jgi:hypothetical protein